MKKYLFIVLLVGVGFGQTNINNIAYCTLLSDGDMDDSPSIYKINLDSSSIDTILSNSILHDIAEDQATMLISPLIESDPSLHVISPIILYNFDTFDDTLNATGYNARFTSDENTIIYSKVGDDIGSQLDYSGIYKYSLNTHESIAVADSVVGPEYLLSNEKNRILWLNKIPMVDSLEILIHHINTNQTDTLEIRLGLDQISDTQSIYWDKNDNIYTTLSDENGIWRLNKLNIFQNPIQFTELAFFDEGVLLPYTADYDLDKFLFCRRIEPPGFMAPYYFQFWTYNVETGETDSLFNFISGTVPLVYSWSADNSKIVIGNLWAWGAFALGTLSIYDAYLDSLTGISEDQRFPLQNPIAPIFTFGGNGILSIQSESIPFQYILRQNYPNPFNPITSLRYELPEDGLVNITIYDMIGRVVKTLVNSSQTAGYKSIKWNATNDRNEPVSAGLYLYTIQAGEFRKTKKMVLLK
tara:strand:- start:281 stop:1687 length:1407 start_codon:yes stop_codon:yes gene_type:complete